MSAQLSLRVPDDLRAQLEARAKERGQTLSSTATTVLRAGLAGSSDDDLDGDLVAAVIARFEEYAGAGVEADRAAAIQLARIGEAGGTAGVAAIKELRALLDGLDDEDDDGLGDLATPA